MADQMPPEQTPPAEDAPQPGEGAAKLEQMVSTIAEGMGTVANVLEQGQANPQGLDMINQALTMFEEGVLIAVGQAPAQQGQGRAMPAPSPEGVPVQ